MTGIEGKNTLDVAIEKEIAQNEAQSLKLYYERRCKMLGDVAMHWQAQTSILYAKFSSSLAVLKQEHEKYKTDSNEEIRKLRVDYEREVDAVNKKYIEVCSRCVIE